MNGKSIVMKSNGGFALKLIVLALALCACSGIKAQVQIPDLVISSLSAKFIAPNKIQYSWTITNVGIGSANLNGPTPSHCGQRECAGIPFQGHHLRQCR